MRKSFLPFLLLLNLAALGQQNLSGSLQHSVYTYVYKISLSDAETLHRKGIETVSERYLHTLVDSFKNEEPLLAAGNYLFVHAAGENLVYELKTAGDVRFKIINNGRDLVMALHTKEGRLITNAAVFINNKALRYDEATQAYRRDKYAKEGLLQATVNGVLYTFPVQKSYARRLTFFQRLTQAAPLKFIVNPLKKLFAKNRSRYTDFYYGTAYERRFKGFAVFNQPKYKPGDTVRLKAFVTTQKGKPLTSKLWLRLSNRNFDTDTVIATVTPYRPGGYEYSFVLHDSLDLDLDEEYLLTLEETKTAKPSGNDEAGNEDRAAKRKAVMRGKFQYEEYELDAVTFSARSNKEEHGRGEELAVYAKATDAAGLAVMDGRLKLLVKTKAYGAKKFTAPAVFLPDTLWQYEGPLEALGETKIVIPDSVFPHAGFTYEVECIFLNSENERQSQTLSLAFKDEQSRIAFNRQGDSLRIDYLVKGKPVATDATLYGFTDKEDTVIAQSLRLPATVTLHPFVKEYEVETDSLYEEYKIKEPPGLVSAQAFRTKDSVAVRLVNPAHLPVWYTLFAGDKIILRGYGDSLSFTEKVRTAKNYFVSLQYIFNDNVYNEDYTVPFRDKLLSLRVTQPEAVYPGQKATVEIAVTDADNQPVAGADLTAYAFTKKFRTAQAPYVPYWGKLYRGRKRYTTFRAGDEEEYTHKGALAWERWSREMHLDTVEYYKFLHPQTLYVNTEPAAAGLTQLAPFVVKNGGLQAVHHLYIDEVPVFFSASESLPRYSFAVEPGKHSLRLRTPQAMLTLDSVDVPKGVKTFLSINADTSNRRIRLQPMPDTLTAYEKNLWGRYTVLMENNFGESYATVGSGTQLFLLNADKSLNPFLVSPLPNRYATLTVKNRFAQAFEAEGGYKYLIEKGLIKQKQLSSPYPFSTRLSYLPPRFSFRDFVLTEGEIDSLWQAYLYNRSASTDLFTNPTINKSGNGALQIGVVKDSANGEPFIRNVLLFKYDDPDFLRIYRGTARDLGFVQQGAYRLLFLLKEDAYVIRDSITVKKDGVNYYKTGIVKPKPKDSVSVRISNIINAKERWTAYNTKDFDGIKESFNQRYSDASLYTETVRGLVKDGQGNPVPYATVVIKGTRNGVQTNAQGRFSLRTLPHSTLVVSGVGYISQEKRVGTDGEYSFTLSSAKQLLSEVVVIGYGTSRSRELTGSVSSISANALAGKLPGVMIRGAASAGSAMPPLIIVNGLPFSGNVNDIDPSSIEGMNVLKAEQATALYGARGVAGVIIITTKSLQGKDATNATENVPVANTLRRSFRDYAYWQPKLITDAAGKVSFTVTYPDDITAWRGFAVAVTDKGQSGFAETEVKSFKAISGSIAMPQFAVQGDTLNVIGKSLNYLGDSIEVVRRFAVNSQMVKEDLLRFQASVVDTFSVAATGDSLKLKYTIEKRAGYFDGEERSIPVVKKGVLETSGTFAALRSDTTFTIQSLADTGTIKLYAETSVIPSLEKEIESIRAYEYLCNEQLASKLKALLVQKRIDSFYNRPFKGEKNVRELVGKLSQSKTAQGLWGWWTGNDPAMWISLHVMEALAEAGAQGYATQLNKQVLTDYLVFNLETYRSTESLSALHLLQLLNVKADYKKYVDTLQTHLPKMSLYEKLRLAELKQKAGLNFSVDSLLRKQSHTMFGNIYFGDEGYRFFDNAVQNTLLMYRILRRMNGHENELARMRGYFLERRKGGVWRNTYESSLILETILPDMLVNDSLPKAAVLSFDGALKQSVAHYPFATEVKSGGPITVRKEGGGPVYFTAYQQYRNAAPKKVAGDFTVTSTFIKGDDAATRLKAGEPVMMKVTVTVKADAAYVMIEAPIPAGCSYKDKNQSYAANEVHREYFKNKVSIFCSELKAGTYAFYVSLLPRYAGRYTLNPAKAEMMYFPVFYGREEMKRVRVE